MALTINTNLPTLSAHGQLARGEQSLAASLERLSSGRRINRAADDSAGMVIADNLASGARGMGQALRNVNDAVSMLQVADGALGQAAGLIQTIRTKAVQAAQDGQGLDSRRALQADINQALNSLRNIAETTSYNGRPLLAGDFAGAVQAGPDAGQTLEISIGASDPEKLGDGTLGQLADISVLSQEGAQAAIGISDAALASLNETRAAVGAQQNQLAATVNNLSATEINTRAAESNIRDVDFAEESMNLAKIKTLNEARALVMAQAGNLHGKNVLSLLQG